MPEPARPAPQEYAGYTFHSGTAQAAHSCVRQTAQRSLALQNKLKILFRESSSKLHAECKPGYLHLPRKSHCSLKIPADIDQLFCFCWSPCHPTDYESTLTGTLTTAESVRELPHLRMRAEKGSANTWREKRSRYKSRGDSGSRLSVFKRCQSRELSSLLPH